MRKPCRCHSDESLYGSLATCPRCKHRSYDGVPGSGEWGGCERRKCGYEELPR
jgi:hypothetical protein